MGVTCVIVAPWFYLLFLFFFPIQLYEITSPSSHLHQSQSAPRWSSSSQYHVPPKNHHLSEKISQRMIIIFQQNISRQLLLRWLLVITTGQRCGNADAIIRLSHPHTNKPVFYNPPG